MGRSWETYIFIPYMRKNNHIEFNRYQDKGMLGEIAYSIPCAQGMRPDSTMCSRPGILICHGEPSIIAPSPGHAVSLSWAMVGDSRGAEGRCDREP